MNKNLQAILSLLNKAEKGETAKLMPALCLLLEIHDLDPKCQLDPELASQVLHALIPTLVRPLVAKVEKSLGVQAFDDEAA